MSARPSQPSPWVAEDLLRVGGLNGVTVLTVLGAWWAASGTVRGSIEMGSVAVGVAAVVLAGVANCRWLILGRRSVASRRIEIGRELEHLAPVRRARPASTELVAVGGTTHFHRSDCQLVAGKAVEHASLARHGRAKRRPCAICRP